MPEGPEVATLRHAREEVKAALEEARKASPVFAGNIALIRMHSACQIHPLIAQIWQSRLPKYILIAANDGYRQKSECAGRTVRCTRLQT